MYFHYRQNNSYGCFDIDDVNGIGPNVWIEADSIEKANEKAFSIGIYFDGVENGQDCDCCGDRWYSPYVGDEVIDIDSFAQYVFYWHDTVYVHKKDGTIERIKKHSS